jgi:hypothetical protein
MTSSVKNLTGKVNAGAPQMRQIGGWLIALGRLDRVAFGDPTNCDRPVSVFSPSDAGRLAPTAARGHPISKRRLMRPIPEAADVTEADRLQCRALIEAASFYAVDYEDDGACWERMLPNGDCLVLAVWKTGLFGKPERKEWTLVRYTGRGTRGDETDPMTLREALSRVAALTPRSRVGD